MNTMTPLRYGVATCPHCGPKHALTVDARTYGCPNCWRLFPLDPATAPLVDVLLALGHAREHWEEQRRVRDTAQERVDAARQAFEALAAVVRGREKEGKSTRGDSPDER